MQTSIDQILSDTFRLAEFRKGQRAIIESVIAKQDTLAVMPTGGGKSLCYQLPAFYLTGVVVVISPLIALMRDQVESLRKLGIQAGCLHSGQETAEKIKVFSEVSKASSYILYLSPERVQKPGFADWIVKQNISLFAIDEAHCVSQWGPDFRPDYHKLKILRELKPDAPILALTATATPTVLKDMASELGLREPARHVYGFYRPNLFYQVETCADDNYKFAMLKIALRKTPQGRILIYCGTRKQAEELTEFLQSEFAGVGFYHAGMSNEKRSEVQAKYSSGEIRILAATNAFGMGIDYPDVRLVVHFQMPASIEAFYQEMGRAGRDGKPSCCLLLYAKKDRGLQSFFIQQSKAKESVLRTRWRSLDAMTQFIEGGECRHSGILTYFRDTERIEACGHCDICSPQNERTVSRPVVEAPAAKFKLRKKSSRGISGSPHPALTSPDAEMRALVLKEWRKAYAKSKDIAAFIVFSDRTLIDLANKNPMSSDELLKVYGMGPFKIEQFGELLLSTLKSLS
jgi:ATP-dependent DNA helicase RecQ